MSAHEVPEPPNCSRKLNRRHFLESAPAVAAVAAGVASLPVRGEPGPLTAGEVHDYLKSLDGGWVDWEKSVDTFKAGSPETVVRGIAVGWMSYTEALKAALDRGCNLFITHEPTYYNHRDNDPKIFRFPGARAKRDFIEQSGIAIIRCHDVWDQYPEIGIPRSWGKLLQLGPPIGGEGYYYLFDGGGRPAIEVARQIAVRTADLGQPGVHFIGETDRPVRRLAVGTGAITPMFHFIETLGADMALCVDDDFTYWRDGAFAVDTGFPVVVVHHPVAEEYGMKLLADHLRSRFPGTPVHHIPQRCMYRLVTGA